MLPDLSSDIDKRPALLLSLTLWWSWGIVTPLILWVDRQIPVSRKQLARRVLAHFVPSLLVTSLYVYLLGAVRAAFGMPAWNGLPSLRFIADSLYRLKTAAVHSPSKVYFRNTFLGMVLT